MDRLSLDQLSLDLYAAVLVNRKRLVVDISGDFLP